MTVNEFLNEVSQTPSLESLDNITVLRWANEAQNIIALQKAPIATREYEVTDISVAFALPDDFLYTEYIELNGEEYMDNLPNCAPGYIKFPETGVYTIYYSKAPNPMTTDNLDMVIEIHRFLQPALIDFIIYKFYDTSSDADTEESQFASKYLNIFNDKVSYVVDELNQKNTSGGYYPTRAGF